LDPEKDLNGLNLFAARTENAIDAFGMPATMSVMEFAFDSQISLIFVLYLYFID